MDGGLARLPAREGAVLSEPSSSVEGRLPNSDAILSGNASAGIFAGLVGDAGALSGVAPGCFSGEGDSEEGTLCVGGGSWMFAIEGARLSLTRTWVELVDSVAAEWARPLDVRLGGGGVVGGFQLPSRSPLGFPNDPTPDGAASASVVADSATRRRLSTVLFSD